MEFFNNRNVGENPPNPACPVYEWILVVQLSLGRRFLPVGGERKRPSLKNVLGSSGMDLPFVAIVLWQGSRKNKSESARRKSIL